MSDQNENEYLTTLPIDLARLARQLGTSDLAMTDTGEERTVRCLDPNVTPEQLKAAVDAHNAAPEPTPMERLQAQIDDLTDLLLGM